MIEQPEPIILEDEGNSDDIPMLDKLCLGLCLRLDLSKLIPSKMRFRFRFRIKIIIITKTTITTKKQIAFLITIIIITTTVATPAVGAIQSLILPFSFGPKKITIIIIIIAIAIAITVAIIRCHG